MQPFDLHRLEDQLRTALTLKADDLLFTVGGEEGSRLQSAFLGAECHGQLATDVFLTPEEIGQIDLSRFQITSQVRRLHRMLESRSLSLSPDQHLPDANLIRQDALEFLEHFLSTLPHVALGGWDATSVRNGELRRFYEDCAAWADLIEGISDAFADEADLHTLRVADLARLSGLELRTIRNKVGPSKPIRTTPERAHKSSVFSGDSFVGVNILDALNWLVERRNFAISTLDPAWVERQLACASELVTVGRSAVMLGLINVGTIQVMATSLGWTDEKLKLWAEDGPSGIPEDAASLAELTGLDPDTYVARCAA